MPIRQAVVGHAFAFALREHCLIDYYTARTLFGNSRKVSIMFAETEMEHVVHFMDLERGPTSRAGSQPLRIAQP